ncbi:conserved exported hypothetical protein [Cupriavidus taiwanensis]|uniref:Uncharacterized protein n=1 Tax=Cupriavidus taiwanensis TaxID=164546 RepID=A0A976G4Q1_9BURK|nr:hypothetical protein [Cupriavidus taiwanensis]SOZ65488.1 conserved exported hypothetical protein [Cupriavidus taiwanensis]SOZ66766.1 conserved exported hypothetical protein [Cupriavidus taiwanensis]SOZ70092.1 conserved exported hypothetical protein [Cupriavidus taiwanensis]SPA01885.1 conserved exported hypothetical protein [Cupriavidus taiwanensis]SPA08648.1 conserved exported hypothetical protein [Cupriavidus taiwanensis]
MKKQIPALVFAGSLAMCGFSGMAMAHGAKPAQYGGIVQVASDLQFELVNRDGAVTIYVDDHDRKLPVAGASGKLTVLTGTRKTETALNPGADNALVAADKLQLQAGSKLVATIRFADGKIVTARFVAK